MRAPRLLLRTTLGLLASVITVTTWLSSAGAVVPVNGAAPAITPVAINASAGNQTNPHVSGDWAVYSSGTTLRYYNFATNLDSPIAGSTTDLLPDISGSKVVFTRNLGSRFGIMVFDAATPAVAPIELDAFAGSTRIGSAIGANTVAYVDLGLDASGAGELVIHDLATSTANRITFDAASDQNPSVSPDGNVVVWEKCATSALNCDIYQAVKSGATWTVSAASNTADPEGNPDTNGGLVVYDATRLGNADVFWRPVAGGAEVQLQLAGAERNPNIAGNYIAFESRPAGPKTDLFVYDIATNKLYQITNTPLVNESLNDITVLPDGRIRVVWSSDEDGANQNNIWGATFSLPPEQVVVVPIPAPTPPLTLVTINDSPGDQTEPNVSGDWAAYAALANVWTVRYYNFATATDAQIPPSDFDYPSEVGGGRVVFSRQFTGIRTGIMLFDAATAAAPVEIDFASPCTRLGPAIGGNTLAYGDYGLHPNGEMVIYDLGTSTSNRITFDTAVDEHPAVSADGSVVTWEHRSSGLNSRDIWQAVKSGTSWTVSVVSASASLEGNPDTNGSLVVYDSYRLASPDIFLRSVAGGPEIQLQMASYDINPSIAGNYIAIESRPTILEAAEIFVYDIVTNKLYQITNTPLVHESLSDITVLPDGRIRVVWASEEDGIDQHNIRSATFSLAPVTCAPPTISVSVSPSVLWPPNNKLVDIHATVTVNSACDPHPTYVLTSITESCSAKHDDQKPNIVGAAYGTPDVDFQLRAAKCDRPGRVYTITYTATDNAGGTASASATVTVPHNKQGHGQVVENYRVVPVALQTPGVVVAIRTEAPSASLQEGDPSDLVNRQGVGGPRVAPAPEFDAASVDLSQIYLGTSTILIAPSETSFADMNGDGHDDLVLHFTGSEYEALMTAPVEVDESITLYYRTANGTGYEVEDLIAAGAPIGLATPGGSPGGPQALPAAGNDVKPSITQLAGVYPNPVRIGASVVFTLAREERVDLAVYDVQGARVRTLEHGSLPPGRYQTSWNGRADDGRRLTSGMYFVRFTAGSYMQTLKTLVMP